MQMQLMLFSATVSIKIYQFEPVDGLSELSICTNRTSI